MEMGKIQDLIKRLDDNEFKTPISVDEDYLYYEDLKDKYAKILSYFSEAEDKKFLQELNEIKDNVLNAIQDYYTGELKNACDKIEKLVKKFEKNGLIVDDVDSHFIFKWTISEQGIRKGRNISQVDLYKARIGDGVESFKASDMIHIPFNKRGLVATQRFSIAGLPCMYLATSTYCCWKELGMPSDNKFNVSYVKLKNIKLFNLAVNLNFLKDEKIKETDFSDFPITPDTFLKEYFKLWLLNLACSYTVKERYRNFKSEYIVPQLIMLALKKNDIDGVVYCSRKIDEQPSSLWLMPKNLNVAIIGKYDKEKCEKILLKNNMCITDSVNYNEFKQLNPKGKIKKRTKSSDIFVNKINGVQIAGKHYPYDYTKFYDFEEYIKSLAEKRRNQSICHN